MSAVAALGIDFGTDTFETDPLDSAWLTEGGAEIYDEGTLGGSSILSEVFAFEVLASCEDALLLKSETEILYDVTDSSIADILVSIDGENVGVSVTRAFHYPPTEPWSEAEALDLLERKLSDLHEATDSVSEADAWSHALLHIIAYDTDHADHMAAAYGSLPDEIKLDTLVFITTTDGDDEYVY